MFNTSDIHGSGLCLLWLLIIVLPLFLFSCSSGNSGTRSGMNEPEVLDDRLRLSLFAEDPVIKTPIGIAIDSLNRVFVLESHTHLEPSDYEGPESDRIRIFSDKNGDGQPDETSVFADGFHDGMNIEFSPEGNLYLVTAREVWALYDRDRDGISDEREKLLELTQPDYVYDHAALMGITFSYNGWMYVTRGNVGSAGWKMEGTDGSFIEGYGDGGNIVRARPDGSHLQEVATGFWNPFDLKFDNYGRLLATDNDPDSRGPNRLVHIVEGGDYGYQSLYGNSGIHPYSAWNGELPGTLPYAAGLGEAPSGLLNTGLTSFPNDYKEEMIISIWEESSIVRTRLEVQGTSVTGSTEVIVQGGQLFRPVSFAADTGGAVYFTDWVVREYPNHGRGRIWKLENKSGKPTVPRKKYADPIPNPDGKLLQELYTYDTPTVFDKLQRALTSEDPFLQNAAVRVLSRPVFRPQVLEAVRSHNADVRLGAMVALHRSGYRDVEHIVRRSLVDEDLRIRQYGLKWIGREGLAGLRPDLDTSLSVEPISEELFKTYLATVRHLRPEFIQAYHNREHKEAKRIERKLPDGFIAGFIRAQSRPGRLRAMAVKYIENPREEMDLLLSLLDKVQAPQLRLEAVRTLMMSPSGPAAGALLKVVREADNPSQLRAEALAALDRQPAGFSEKIIPLLDDFSEDVQIEAARYLRTRLSGKNVRQKLRETYATTNSEPLKRQIAFTLTDEQPEDTAPNRPSSLEEWQKVLAEDGIAQRGRRVFYSVHSTCSTCHAIHERGGDLGPDLTNAGQSKTRNQLVHSIFRPSEQISPQWQGWYIKLKDGTTQQGRQINVGNDDIEIYTQTGEVVSIDKSKIEDYGILENSLMPSGLETRLTVSDMRDLVTFLEANSHSETK